MAGLKNGQDHPQPDLDAFEKSWENSAVQETKSRRDKDVAPNLSLDHARFARCRAARLWAHAVCSESVERFFENV